MSFATDITGFTSKPVITLTSSIANIFSGSDIAKVITFPDLDIGIILYLLATFSSINLVISGFIKNLFKSI